MLCQGCHTPDGTGGNDTPKMKGHIGHFLSTQQGREYLVRVPGSANSTLDDPQLAEVLNWIITEMGGESVPENMDFYTADEVAEFRKEPLFEVTQYRKQLLATIKQN
ncbi:MAG: cytochrome c, class I [Gammaproteobacteria bacterium]|nr:MAG: cytochrome c, class I [Gammaproteobacteria bacterium]